jgi:hypothetical protein
MEYIGITDQYRYSQWLVSVSPAWLGVSMSNGCTTVAAIPTLVIEDEAEQSHKIRMKVQDWGRSHNNLKWDL